MSLKYNIKNLNTSTSIFFNNCIDNNCLDEIKTILENDDNFKVYSNDTDLNSENNYKNVTDYIYRIVENSEFLCRNLEPVYIKIL